MEIVYDGTDTRVTLRKDDGTEVDLLKLEGALTLAQKSRERNRSRVVALEDRLERIRKILAEDGGLSDPPAYDPEAAAEVLAENYDRARRKVTQLEADLTRIRAAVLGTELARELKEYREASAAMLLVEALTEVRRVIGATDSSVSNRVYTVAEVGDLQASEAELVAAPLRRRVAELEYDLERYRRAHVCTVECKPNAHTAFQGRVLVAELEVKIQTERGRADRAEALAAAQHERAKETESNEEYHLKRIEELDRDRHTERDRADQNKAWAERAEANGVKLSAALVEAEKQRDSARRRVAELEDQLARSIDREATDHIRSLASRDNLLSAATTRIKHAREALAAPKVTKTRDEIVTSKGAILADAIGMALAELDD